MAGLGLRDVRLELGVLSVIAMNCSDAVCAQREEDVLVYVS